VARGLDAFKDDIIEMFSRIRSLCEVGRSMENGIKVHIDIKRDSVGGKSKFPSDRDYFDLEDIRKIVKASYWMEDELVATIIDAEPKDPNEKSIEKLSDDPFDTLTRDRVPNSRFRILRNTSATTQAFFAGKRLRTETVRPFKGVNDLVKGIKSTEDFASTFSPFHHQIMHIKPLDFTSGPPKARVAYCLPSHWGDTDSIMHWLRTYLSFTYSSLSASFSNDLFPANFKEYDAFIMKGAGYLGFRQELPYPHEIQRGERSGRSRSRNRSYSHEISENRRRSRSRSKSRTRQNAGRVLTGQLGYVQTEDRRSGKAPPQAQSSSTGPPIPRVQTELPERSRETPGAPTAERRGRPGESANPARGVPSRRNFVSPSAPPASGGPSGARVGPTGAPQTERRSRHVEHAKPERVPTSSSSQQTRPPASIPATSSRGNERRGNITIEPKEKERSLRRRDGQNSLRK
jgi:hypothetical protein